MFSQVAFILSHPSHPGNIGSCARAIKTMGFSQLILINPKDYPNHQATALASGAHDILKNAKVVPSLDEALKPFHYIIGASARQRSLSWPCADSRTTAKEVVGKLSNSDQKVAILFGTENSGLSNDELRACDKHVYIPSNPDYGSLNLAQAVQVISYELRMQILEGHLPALEERTQASYDQKEGFYQHLEATLRHLEILNPNQPRQLMGRLRRIFNRAELDETEVNILRGILKAILKSEVGTA